MKSNQITVTVLVKVPVEIKLLCDLLEITPMALLETFMEDLGSGNITQGSDERRIAKEWFLRGSISTFRDLFEWDDITDLVWELEYIRQQCPAYTSDKAKTYLKKRSELLDEWFESWRERKKEKDSPTI